jgi:hypothetical protein
MLDQLAQVLGSEEFTILKVVRDGINDVRLIHLVTGIPEPCVISKVNALIAIGFLVRHRDGFAVSQDCSTVIDIATTIIGVSNEPPNVSEP